MGYAYHVIKAVLAKSIYFLARLHSTRTAPSDFRPTGTPRMVQSTTLALVWYNFDKWNIFLVSDHVTASIARYVDVRPKTPKSKNRTRIFQHNLTPYLNSSDHSTSIVPSKVEIKFFPRFPTTLNFVFLTSFIILVYAPKFRNLI